MKIRRILALSLLLFGAVSFSARAEEEPVKVTEVKLKDGNTIRALKFSTLSANGMRSYSILTVENKRLGLQDKEVASYKEISVRFADLPEAARTEIARQRASVAAKAAEAAPKEKPAALAKAPAIAGVAPAFVARIERGGAGVDDRVTRALKWLAENQEADGRWSNSKHKAAFQQDTAVTGLALMAFLSSGHGEKFGEHKDVVRKGLAWLKSKQSADGLVYDDTDDKAIHRKIGYPHAIAMTALCEAAGMNGAPDTKQAAQKAVEYAVLKQQHKNGGWRYMPGSEGCLSVSGWYIGGLKAAKSAGLRVPPEGFLRAAEFLDSVAKKVEGGNLRTFWYMPSNEHAQTAFRLTMIGHASLANLGRPDAAMQDGVAWATLRGQLPGSRTSTDLYYWYYGMQAAFYAGGDVEERWRAALSEALTQSQTLDGSFDPSGDYSEEWGRVGQTALAVLCLEMPVRYPKVAK